jgi:hypothetical protein
VYLQYGFLYLILTRPKFAVRQIGLNRGKHLGKRYRVEVNMEGEGSRQIGLNRGKHVGRRYLTQWTKQR